MYSNLLIIHNVLRWIVLALLIIGIIISYFGAFGKKKWSELDRKIYLFVTLSLDLQFLLGLVLYLFYSPITKTGFADLGNAVRSDEMRFYLFEHGFFMFAALIIAHVGSIMAKKANKDKVMYQRYAIWFTIVAIILFLGIPWSRPLFRWF